MWTTTLGVVTKLAHGIVVNVGQAATLDAPQRLQARVFAALVVQVRLEVVVDDLAVGLREAGLGLVVAVAKIVTLAAGQEVVTERLVGGVGAAVRGPVQIGWVFGVPRRLERRHRCVQEEIVRRRQAGGVARATEEVGNRERKGERGREESEEGEEEKEESLHCGGGGFFLGSLTDVFKLRVVGNEEVELRCQKRLEMKVNSVDVVGNEEVELKCQEKIGDASNLFAGEGKEGPYLCFSARSNHDENHRESKRKKGNKKPEMIESPNQSRRRSLARSLSIVKSLSVSEDGPH